MLSEHEFDAFLRLLAKHRHGPGLDPSEEQRLRQILSREEPAAYQMAWDELMHLATIVGGMWFVRKAIREGHLGPAPKGTA